MAAAADAALLFSRILRRHSRQRFLLASIFCAWLTRRRHYFRRSDDTLMPRCAFDCRQRH